MAEAESTHQVAEQTRAGQAGSVQADRRTGSKDGETPKVDAESGTESAGPRQLKPEGR